MELGMSLIQRSTTSGSRLPRTLVLLLLTGSALLPTVARAQTQHELTRLIDCPTAGVISKGSYELDLRLFGQGGLSGQLAAGALQRLTISVAYGGEQIIGNSSVDWYPRLEAGVRYRIATENTVWPAIVLGYETQGYGGHADGRYETKSRGVFVALSKNYISSLGQFGLHGGVNMTRETDDGDDDISGWLGFDKSINDQLMLIGEYDLGRSQDGRRDSGLADALLNAGVRFAVAPELSIAVLFKDLLTTRRTEQITRELSVRYTEEF
jgi:hypothetical protein